MKRELQSITIRYYATDTSKKVVPDRSVVITYRITDSENILMKNDIVVIHPSSDYSNYEDDVKKICQIAFEK